MVKLKSSSSFQFSSVKIIVHLTLGSVYAVKMIMNIRPPHTFPCLENDTTKGSPNKTGVPGNI